MRNLIAFFVKYHVIVLFIILQIISFNLIVSFNSSQRKAYLSSSSSISGFLFEKKQNIKDYFDLKNQNTTLLNENKRIRSQLFDLQILFESNLENKSIVDSLDKQRYTLIPARIINNSTSLPNNQLTIDKGKAQNVQPHQGVIGDQGIVGVVNKVTNNFSTVISILNSDLPINASIKENGFFGNLVWDSKSPNHMVLKAIPKHAHIEEGYTLITNGYSSKFPTGIEIGTIEEFRVEEGSNFYEIKVRLKNELGNMKYVYIVDDLMKNELDTLVNE